MSDNNVRKLTEHKTGDKLDYHYQKSPDYRTIHCDGAHGGVTSRGYLAFTFYNERGVIPRRGSREILESDGEGSYFLGEEIITDSLGGIMRQLETTVLMDINAAREFYVWLKPKIAEMEASMKMPAEVRVTRDEDQSAQGKKE